MWWIWRSVASTLLTYRCFILFSSSSVFFFLKRKLTSMFSSARLFAFVFFFLFFLSCILISRLIFTTFSSGNMLSFFFYVIIYCWSYLFTFIFHAESVGVYVHFDFLCWYLAFFDQLIIIVLCSFDSKQIPRNKKKCCSQSFF